MRRTAISAIASLMPVIVALVVRPASGSTITLAPTDSYTKLEAAKAGDEVIIDPGTYKFRVYLTAVGTASNPILIHAKDPQNPPVWDLSAGNVEDAPGSYTAGDRGRGCWQFSGAKNIYVSDIVIAGCHNAAHNSAGIRYYNTSTGIKLTNVVFHDNDNGLTGGTQQSELTAEYCEFNQNGTLLASSSAPSHNIYIYGGTFALRYSYVHDPIQAQNFHIRATASTIEYNWFARAKSYAGDLMTDDDNAGRQPSTQNMTFRGNVIVQGAIQSNTSQIIAVYNDAGVSNLTLNVTLLYNTFIGNGGHPALVHLSNADGTVMSATLYNNIIYGTSATTLVEDSAHGTIKGANNWLMTGASTAGLTGSIFGADPGFKNAAQSDFTLATGSNAIGAALASVAGLPHSEYYRDENLKCYSRARLSANDLGAFESTTQGSGVGPHSGGTSATGGTSAGGTSATGGATKSAGGTSSSAGGTTATGGTAKSAGGTTASGGVSLSAGGTAAVAGASGAAGGSLTTGGTVNSTSGTGIGGTVAPSTASGGATSSTTPVGGSAASAGQSPVVTTSGANPATDSGGCGCRAARTSSRSEFVAVILGLTLLLRRRRTLARVDRLSQSGGLH